MIKEVLKAKQAVEMTVDALQLIAELKDSDVDGDGLKDYDEVIAIGLRILEREKENIADLKELARLTGGNFEKIKEVLGK